LATIHPAVEAAAVTTIANDPALMKRLDVMQTLGKEIQKKRRQIETAQAGEAEAVSGLKSAREVLHKKERELSELHDELATIAQGKNSERLFPVAGEVKADSAEPKANSAAPSAPSTESQDSWKSVRIDTLTPKLAAGKLKALAENDPPILTVEDLAEWQAGRGVWWAKDIKGLGDKGQEQLALALESFWASRPKLEAAAEQAKAGAAFDDATPKEDTRETIIESDDLYKLAIVQCADGRWTHTYSARVGKHRMDLPLTPASWPSRVEAITAALIPIGEFVRGRQREGLKNAAKNEADVILQAMDALHAKLMQDGEAAEPIEQIDAAKKNRRGGKKK
jgi:hypothetical protein